MSKIALDVSSLNPLSLARGIGIYAQRLAETLPRVDKTNEYILATSPNQLKGADLIHYPYFDFFFHTLRLKKHTKRIVTIHDLIPLVFPDQFKPGIRGKLKFKLQLRTLRQVDAIITDSQSSQRDIVKYLKIKKDKIDVVYLGVGQEFKPIKSKENLEATSQKYHLDKPFILYIGDVNYNKNLPILLEAFSKLKDKSINLVMASKAFRRNQIPEVKIIERKITELNLRNRVKQITNLPADSATDLIHLYNLAQVYVQPSLYEGFGLPVIEAMACGTPVVATKVASLPEVYGNAAIVAEPTVNSLAQGFEKALALAPGHKQNLIKRGFQQAAKFTWEKTARETIKVYNSVIGS